MDINKKRDEVMERLKNFQALQEYRNMDFPKNLLNVCKNNLQFYFAYFNSVICNKNDYRPKLDTVLVTYIINYLSSVKSYINRKKRSIEGKKVPGIYKNSMLSIIEKYWTKRGQKVTKIDILIEIRDKFEHECIEGISIRTEYNQDSIFKTVMIGEANINALFVDAYKELELMNEEIEKYLKVEMDKINLRDCILFMNAFNRFYNKQVYSLLFPEETEEEIEAYDNLLKEL